MALCVRYHFITALAFAFLSFGLLTAASITGVDLGTAGDFVVLSKTGVTNAPTSDITGSIGAYPITAAASVQPHYSL